MVQQQPGTSNIVNLYIARGKCINTLKLNLTTGCCETLILAVRKQGSVALEVNRYRDGGHTRAYNNECLSLQQVANHWPSRSNSPAPEARFGPLNSTTDGLTDTGNI